MPTRTGNFPIGFRRGGGAWQKDLAALASWSREQGFDAIDLSRVSKSDADTLTSAGLRLGSVDVIDLGQICATDPGKRKAVLEANLAYIPQAVAAGAKVFFTVILPGDASAKRSDNYRHAVDCYTPIAEAIDKAGGKLAIEGWPGGAPHYPAMCCTPETCRRIMTDIPFNCIGFNYDPSHLIRLGVDHIRFLHEFLPRIFHVHAKDTELMADALYEYGLYQPAVFDKPHGFGEHVWRYTLPGHGVTRWTEAFRILSEASFPGIISIELEDEHFNGSEAGEKSALIHSLAFLKGA
jgi:sugar phosphate isomerase/epimerase